MPEPHDTNKRTPSTTFGWRRVKISAGAAGRTPQRAAGAPHQALARRDPRKPLTVTIVYRGGSECWWELRARGVVLRRPGALALHDVLSLLEGGG